MKVPIAKTNLLDNELSSILEPLKSGWLVQGPQVKEFEEKWSNFTGAKFSNAVTSCTSALHLSLLALGLKRDDEIIVPAFSWISTANVVEHVGAKVVFCDIDINTFNIDILELEKKITNKTKAIIPVHLFGLSADLENILDIAKKNNLYVVEDAACGFGAKFRNKHVGTFGQTGCFSFHPRKAITTGEGGMITTDDIEIAKKIQILRDHGATKSDLQRHEGSKPYLLAEHTEAGFNQRMTDIQAALGNAQMNRAEEIVKERQEIAKKYDAAFENIEWLKTPSYEDHYVHGYQSYPCLFEPERLDAQSIEKVNDKRNLWMLELQESGISTRPSTHAIHMLSFYRKKYNHKAADFMNSYKANHCSISLPLYNGMTEDEQNYVIEKILNNHF